MNEGLNNEALKPFSIPTCSLTFPVGIATALGEALESPELRTLVEKVLTYRNAEHISEKKPTEGDCTSIAGEAVQKLGSFFEKNGYALGIAVSESRHGAIPAFKTLGYGHHTINVAIGEDSFFAFDLTASYTLPELASDVVFAAAENERELLSKLKAFTGSKWELR
jgi:hypothetical protein